MYMLSRKINGDVILFDANEFLSISNLPCVPSTKALSLEQYQILVSEKQKSNFLQLKLTA